VKFGIGLYLWTTDIRAAHLHLLGDMKRAGYDGVEIPVGSGTTRDCKRIRRVLDQESLSCSTIMNVAADKNTVSPDPRVRRAALDEIKLGVESSHTLGSEILVGPYQAAYAHFTGAGPTEEELDRSAEVLREAAEFARSAGVRLAIEFLNRHEGYLLNTMEQSAALAHRVDHLSLGVLYDTHHAHAEEDDVSAAIRLNGECIYHVHFSESNRGTLGAGLVDWRATVAALKDINYDGWVVAEAFAADVPPLSSAAHVWRDTFPSKDLFAQHAIRFMRNVMA
jgi:D-psicose/D-tagatose/L-ribulose 3-epimerase